MEVMLHALGLLFEPYTLAVMLIASVFGLFVGAMPGLTATMATALDIPGGVADTVRAGGGTIATARSESVDVPAVVPPVAADPG